MKKFFSLSRLLVEVDVLAQRLLEITEWYRHRRQIKKAIETARRRRRGWVLEWVWDFLWTVGFVFLLNQYILQSYMIPSGSMIPSLRIGDYLFVERWSYGAQLFLGIDVKLPAMSTPRRGDIITFENPDFESKGILHDVAQRLLFLLTLSFVDLDRTQNGEPAIRLLVKRLVGDENTLIKVVKGELFFQPRGLGRWLSEGEYNRVTQASYAYQRLIRAEDYFWYADFVWGQVLYNQGFISTTASLPLALKDSQHSDSEELRRLFQKYKAVLFPHKMEKEKRIALGLEGARYVPVGHVLPIGDNRDNSLDGRLFGVIEKKKLQGKAYVRFFPLSRVGRL